MPTNSEPKLALSPLSCFCHSSEKVTDTDAPSQKKTKAQQQSSNVRTAAQTLFIIKQINQVDHTLTILR